MLLFVLVCTCTVCYLTQPSAGCSPNDTAPCQLCLAEWLPILYNQACTSMYCPTPTDWVCAETNSTNGTCIPLQQPCEGQRCDKSHSLCQPTGRCLPLSTPTTCDNSSTTCLVDQALVERNLSRRTCEDASSLLSMTGQSCTDNGTVYCAICDRCVNVDVLDPCILCTPNSAPVLATDSLFAGEVRRNFFADPATEQFLESGVFLADLLANGTGGKCSDCCHKNRLCSSTDLQIQHTDIICDRVTSCSVQLLEFHAICYSAPDCYPPLVQVTCCTCK